VLLVWGTGRRPSGPDPDAGSGATTRVRVDAHAWLGPRSRFVGRAPPSTRRARTACRHDTSPGAAHPGGMVTISCSCGAVATGRRNPFRGLDLPARRALLADALGVEDGFVCVELDAAWHPDADLADEACVL